MRYVNEIDEDSEEVRWGRVWKEYQCHITALETELGKAGFPTLPLRDIIVVASRCVDAGGAMVPIYHFELSYSPVSKQALSTVHFKLDAGVGLVEQARKGCWLPDDFYTLDLEDKKKTMMHALFELPALEVAAKNKMLEGFIDSELFDKLREKVYECYSPQEIIGGKIGLGVHEYLVNYVEDTLEELLKKRGLIRQSLIPIGKDFPEILSQLVTKAFPSSDSDEEGALFHTGLIHPSLFQEMLKSGVVTDLGLLYQIGDDSKEKEDRFKAFSALATRHMP